VKGHQADHPIATVCRVLGVSPSGYYAWRHRAPSARAEQDAELTMKIHTIHLESRGTYGAPRVHAELAAQDMHVGRKRVARLMRAAGVRGVSRRKWVTTTTRDLEARPAPDLVQRDFHVDGPAVAVEWAYATFLPAPFNALDALGAEDLALSPGVSSPAWFKLKPKITIDVIVTGSSADRVGGHWGEAVMLNVRHPHPRTGAIERADPVQSPFDGSSMPA
jgi:hypothetical protein